MVPGGRAWALVPGGVAKASCGTACECSVCECVSVRVRVGGPVAVGGGERQRGAGKAALGQSALAEGRPLSWPGGTLLSRPLHLMPAAPALFIVCACANTVGGLWRPALTSALILKLRPSESRWGGATAGPLFLWLQKAPPLGFLSVPQDGGTSGLVFDGYLHAVL